MAKSTQKSIYYCSECGAESPKWSGQCGECESWNTLVEQQVQKASVGVNRFSGGLSSSEIQNLSEIKVSEIKRLSSGSKEFDRVLGGGLVNGSVVLIGGDPGIGKSTLLLQNLCAN